MHRAAPSTNSGVSARQTVALGALAAIAILATLDGWIDLIETAARHHDSDASILAPPVAAWLFWQRRAAFREPARLRILAIPLALASVALVGYSVETDTHVAAQFGALLSVFAAFVGAFGARAARGTLAAWGALVFSIPIPGLLRLRIAQPLQEYGALLSQKALAPLGFAVERLGASLVIDGVPVAVSEACDGMRMVSALVLVVYAVSFGRESRGWVRAVMLLSAPVLALACNTLRLVPTVLGYAMLDQKTADVAHDVLGWLTLPICLVLIELLRAAISSLAPGGTAAPAATPRVEASSPRHAPAGFGVPVATALAFAAAWTALPTLETDPAIEARYAAVRESVESLPERIGPWRTSPVPVPLAEQRILKPNAMISRRLSLLGSSVEAQLLLIHCRDVRDMLGHWPATCYVSAGWSPEPGSGRTLAVPRDGLELKSQRHRFSRVRGGSDLERTEVWSAFLAPGEPTTGSLDDLSGRAGARLRSQQGIAQIQVCFSGWIPDAQADEAVGSVLRAIPLPLLELLKGDGRTPQASAADAGPSRVVEPAPAPPAFATSPSPPPVAEDAPR